MDAKTCTKCRQTKSLDEFSPNGDRYQSQCKVCRSKKASYARELARTLDPSGHNPLERAARTPKAAQWTPGVNTENEIIVSPAFPQSEERDFTWDKLLVAYGLNPDEYEIQEPVYFNKWDAQTPEGVTTMFQHKAKIVKRTKSSADVQLLIDDVNKWRKPKKPSAALGEGVFSVVIADWQVGGVEGEQGSESLLGRVLHAIESVKERVAELKKMKRPLGVLQVICVGDLVENCDGFYPSQLNSVDLDLRSQVRLTRQLLARAIHEWSELFPEVRVVAVGGNHGENRGQGGKLRTGQSDNWDLSIVESVAEVFSVNPERYGHVKFLIPRKDLSITVDVCGWVMGVHHGHLARRGGATSEAKLKSWYDQQAGGGMPIGDANILVTGHYHHLRVAQWGKCVWVQAPALDNGSQWFQDSTGQHSDPGVLTFCTYPERRLADLEVLDCPVELRNNPQPVRTSAN